MRGQSKRSDYRKILPSRYPIPKKTKITVATTTATKQATFPLRVTRVVVSPAGPSDLNVQMYIQHDGGVLASLGKGQVTCTLDKTSLQVLNAAAVRIGTPTSPSGASAPTTDGPVLVFFADRQTNLVNIDDPRVGAARQVVEQLLKDVSVPAPQRIACR